MPLRVTQSKVNPLQWCRGTR